MDVILEQIIDPTPKGRVVSFYCPDSVYEDLRSLAKLVGSKKQSALITLCLIRQLPTLRQQILQPHIKPQGASKPKDKLRALVQKKKQEKAPLAVGSS